jgi:hypothetical protein
MCGYTFSEVRKDKVGKKRKWQRGRYLMGVTHGRHMFAMRHGLGPGLCPHVCHVVEGKFITDSIVQ